MMGLERRVRQAMAAGLVVTGVACGMAAAAEPEGLPRWVQGSWVNVREAGHAKAPVVTQLVANTLVRLLEAPSAGGVADAFCRIRWGQDQQGWMACALLGEAPLRIEDVSRNQLAPGQPNPAYSPLRAFWLQPSLERLVEVAEHLRQTRLSRQQLAAETVDERFVWERRPALKRVEIPEFEAMKSLLRQGVVEPAALHPEPGIDWETLKAAAQAAERAPSGAIEDGVLLRRLEKVGARFFHPAAALMLRQIELPAIQPSRFGAVATQLGPATATAEQLSAQFQRPYTVGFRGKPQWETSESSGPYIRGWWDIGEMQVGLLAPLQQVQVSVNGRVSQGPSRAERSFWGGDCREGFRYSGPPEPTWPAAGLAQRGADWPLLRLYSPTPWPLREARVQLSERRALRTQHPQLPAYNRHEIVHEAQWLSLDLDHDGQPDLLVWEGWRPDVGDPGLKPGPSLRLVFANAAGRWSLLYVDEYQSCGD